MCLVLNQKSIEEGSQSVECDYKDNELGPEECEITSLKSTGEQRPVERHGNALPSRVESFKKHNINILIKRFSLVHYFYYITYAKAREYGRIYARYRSIVSY